jgi:hypothetical protein
MGEASVPRNGLSVQCTSNTRAGSPTGIISFILMKVGFISSSTRMASGNTWLLQLKTTCFSD